MPIPIRDDMVVAVGAVGARQAYHTLRVLAHPAKGKRSAAMSQDAARIACPASQKRLRPRQPHNEHLLYGRRLTVGDGCCFSAEPGH